MSFLSRKYPRLSGYDYQTLNYYFLTLCTHQHRCIFGPPGRINQLGCIAAQDFVRIPTIYPGIRIDKYVVMPNHIHVIVVIEDPNNTPGISQIIALYKTGVTKQIRSIKPGMQVWQRSFYDHIIRNQESYEEIWTYIDGNPQKWETDKFHIDF